MSIFKDRAAANRYMAELAEALRRDGKPTEAHHEEADKGPESRLQARIEDYCRAEGYMILSIPKWATRFQAVRRFLPAGWPDVTVFCKGKVVLMELKAEHGTLRKDQEHFRLVMYRLGFPVETVRSFVKAKALLDSDAIGAQVNTTVP